MNSFWPYEVYPDNSPVPGGRVGRRVHGDHVCATMKTEEEIIEEYCRRTRCLLAEHEQKIEMIHRESQSNEAWAFLFGVLFGTLLIWAILMVINWFSR